MWKGRKSAFAAVGRISRDYMVQDGVIPRSDIGRVLQEIADLATKSGLRIANVFHAGDGNLHPLVLFDARVRGETARAEEVSGEILRICLRYGGSITGEHGVGHDKAPYMAEMFTEADLDTMGKLRCALIQTTCSIPARCFRRRVYAATGRASTGRTQPSFRATRIADDRLRTTRARAG